MEGLSVSYFLRNSIMYDTLMQMGRWFGYRDGYEDLCRIYMTPEAESWYAHISEATDELRSEFKRMKKAMMTPKDFGLSVRSHPQSLIVTARNKMRSGTEVLRQINLEGSLIETSVLVKKPDVLSQNYNSFTNFISKCNDFAPVKENEKPYGYFWKAVPIEYVKGFLEGFANHPASIKTSSAPIIDYLNKLNNRGIDHWSVFIPSLKHKGTPVDINGLMIHRPTRTVMPYHDNGIAFNKRRVGEAQYESAGIDEKD